MPILDRRNFLLRGGAAAALALPGVARAAVLAPSRPNILLVMSDDQGYGDTGYAGLAPVRTPVLDEMAARGLRLDRFYAAAPVCSPTRASCLTGRHPDRYGVFSWGYTLPIEERTLAELLKADGYATGHFGKWHLGGVPGREIDKGDRTNRGGLVSARPPSPGNQGYDEWFAAPNKFDVDPDVFYRNGEPVGPTEGEGSQIVARAALDWLRATVGKGGNFFATVWFGSPHAPHRAAGSDLGLYEGIEPRRQRYYAEITAMDRAIGVLRDGLRELGVSDNTLVWFCSDNGASGKVSNGALRGSKSQLWEGGLRVPALIEWPAGIPTPMRTSVPASTLDIFPTIADIVGLDPGTRPLDGLSLTPLFANRMAERPIPIPFERRSRGHRAQWAALVGNRYKLHVVAAGASRSKRNWPPEGGALYDLVEDPGETTNVAEAYPETVAEMGRQLEAWQASVNRSLGGADYART